MNARRLGSFLLASLLIVFWVACNNIAGPDSQYTGTIEYLSFEGGFFDIATDGGSNFDPLNLPAEFAVDGLRVRFEGKARPDKGSVHMWGIAFEIRKIERL